MAALLREEPRLCLWLLLYVPVTFGILTAVLAGLGSMDAFWEWSIVPTLLAGSLWGSRLVAAAARQDPSSPDTRTVSE